MLLFHFEVHLSVLKAWAKHFDMDKEAAFGYAVREQHCVVVTESWQGKRTGIFAFIFFLDNQLPAMYLRQHKNGVFLHQRHGEASSLWNSLL